MTGAGAHTNRRPTEGELVEIDALREVLGQVADALDEHLDATEAERSENRENAHAALARARFMLLNEVSTPGVSEGQAILYEAHLEAISKAIQRAQGQLRWRIDHSHTDVRNCPQCVALNALDSALLLTLDLQSSSEPGHNAVPGRGPDDDSR